MPHQDLLWKLNTSFYRLIFGRMYFTVEVTNSLKGNQHSTDVPRGLQSKPFAVLRRQSIRVMLSLQDPCPCKKSEEANGQTTVKNTLVTRLTKTLLTTPSPQQLKLKICVMGWQNRLKFIGKTNQLKISLQNAYLYYFGKFRVFLWYSW